MLLIECKDLHLLPSQKRAISLTFGNFDGVHLGHQQIISALKNPLIDGTIPLVALMTFKPHPMTFFSPQKEDFLLLNQLEKMKLLQNSGLDILFNVNFDEKFSRIKAEDFIRILMQNLNIKRIVTGENCKFGYKAEGDCLLIKNLAKVYDYEYIQIKNNFINSVKVSSSEIRALIKKGNVEEAASLFGRSPYIAGNVIKGEKRARSLGFPTCNLSLEGVLKPKFGVFLVKIYHKNNIFYGVANLGIRPTFNQKIPLAEVHILNFDREIYHEYIKVELLYFIRDEKKFNNVDELKHQINLDVMRAQSLLNRYTIY